MGVTTNATGNATIKPTRKDLSQITKKSDGNPTETNVITKDITNDIIIAIITPNKISGFLIIQTALFF